MDGVRIASAILTLIAGTGIFLIACSMMSANLETLGGKRLKALFDKARGSKIAGVCIGTVATAAVQSSSATTVMTIGFVDAGIMTLAQAAAVIFGANVGTTVTGLIVASGMFGGSISVSVVLAAFAGIGAFVLAFAKRPAAKSAGGLIAGFGMLFAGLSVMSGAMNGIAELDAVKNFLALFSDPFLLVAVGALMTATVQSSSVMTSIAITSVLSGLITLDQGIYITLGSNIGTCATALIAGIAGSKNAKRAALIHLFFNIGGVAVFMLVGFFLYLGCTGFGQILSEAAPNAPQLQLAVFHAVFNLATAIMALPLTNPMVKLVTKIVPDKKTAPRRKARRNANKT